MRVPSGSWLALALILAAAWSGRSPASPDVDEPDAALAARFAQEVGMRLVVPSSEQRAYGSRLQAALAAAGLGEVSPQYFLLVDRSPVVQAAFVYRLTSAGEWNFVGAAPVSTGQAGGFEHFITPTGVFVHSLANRDFRAEGTRNENGVRGYGVRGMRVFDFGWVEADRTWGPRGRGFMRLQVHATDPDLLEKQLGRPRSKGCIRIPASLNEFLDRRGLLDAEYEQGAREGRHFWILRADREPVDQPGKYLVIVDSGRKTRPAWSPWPPRRDKPASSKLRLGEETVPPLPAGPLPEKSRGAEFPEPGSTPSC